MRHKTELDISKISQRAAIDKGIDYTIDITIFYGAFIALSIFWLHERTRDTKALLDRISSVEESNGDLEARLDEIRQEIRND